MAKVKKKKKRVPAKTATSAEHAASLVEDKCSKRKKRSATELQPAKIETSIVAHATAEPLVKRKKRSNAAVGHAIFDANLAKPKCERGKRASTKLLSVPIDREIAEVTQAGRRTKQKKCVTSKSVQKVSKAVESGAMDAPKKTRRRRGAAGAGSTMEIAEATATAAPASTKSFSRNWKHFGRSKTRFSCYVGGIPFSTNPEQVKADFEECGEILDFRYQLDAQGRPKGYCFIDFATEAGLAAAIAYDGEDYGGRILQVKEADSSRGGTSRGKIKGKENWDIDEEGTGRIDPDSKPAGCTSVVLKNLAYGVNEHDLRRHFQVAGNVVNVTLLKDKATGEPNGIGFVDFEETGQVDKAIELNNSNLKGRRMHVNYSRTRKKK